MRTKKTSESPRSAPAEGGAEPLNGEATTGAGAERGRPGRRTVLERRDAVLALLSGKATVDQLARRYGVLPQTIEGWRIDALQGIENCFRHGDPSPRERELERELRQLRSVVTDLSIKHALAEQALKSRPSLPARSQA